MTLEQAISCLHTYVRLDRASEVSWLAYLGTFAPEADVLAYHWCPTVFHELCLKNYRVVYRTSGPYWLLQPVLGDDDSDDESVADIFGGQFHGFIIEYCPGCGVALPDLGEAHVLDPSDGVAPGTMAQIWDVAKTAAAGIRLEQGQDARGERRGPGSPLETTHGGAA